MKFKRTERIGAIVKILSDNPNKIFTLSHFTNQFNAAKSTISEDLLVVKNVFEKLELGKVITISGAAGGVKYIPKTSKAENEEFLLDLCQKISDPSRILSGGFLYLIDLIYNPTIVSKIGKIMASNIDYAEADYVVTMETKGIPMALMTAKAMNLPLVIIRKDIKVSEGPTLSMTYVSGNTSKVESMSLPRKALKPDSKVIIIDDFMRGGGTIKGMIDLMTEFGAEVVGTGVFISTTQPEEKMVKNYISLIELDVQGDKISVQPNLKTFKDEYKNEDYEENYDLEDVLDETKILVASGSYCQNMPLDYYKVIGEICKNHNIKFILDTSGEALKVALESNPYLIKPNTDEIKQLLNINIESKEEIISAGMKLLEMGAQNVCISLGKDGMVYLNNDEIYEVIVPKVEAVNTVGSGDSTIAGFSVGVLRNYETVELLKLANSCGISNAMNIETGFVKLEEIEKYSEQVQVKKLECIK